MVRNSWFSYCRGILRQTSRNLTRTPATQLLTLITVMLSVLIFAFFLLIHLNLQTITAGLGENFRIIVHLNEEISPQIQPRIEKQIRQYGGISKVVFLSREEVFSRFVAQAGNEQDILAELGPDFLPPAIEITPQPGALQPSDFKELAAFLITLPNADKLQYGQEWLERFNKFNQLLRVLVLISAGLLILNMIFIISHTVRLTVAARSEELTILHLLGADRSYIRAPFLVEGLLLGGIGSLSGLGALYLFYQRAGEIFGHSGLISMFSPSFLPTPLPLILVATGALLCTLSSLVTINKAIRN